MNAATRQHLNDLKAAGFDVSNLETQMQVNPILDREADRLIGGGVMRQKEFSRFSQKFLEKEKGLEKKVNDLARLHDTVESFADDPDIQERINKDIKLKEDELISEGHDPAEVRALSAENKSGITIKEKFVVNKGDENVDTSNFIDTKTFQQGMANIANGSVAVANKINHQINRAMQLGIDVTDEMIDKLNNEVITKLAAGNADVGGIADSILGISVKKTEIADATRVKELEDVKLAAKAEGRAEAEKEFGGSVPRNRIVGRKESAIYSRNRRSSNVELNEDGTPKVDQDKLPQVNVGKPYQSPAIYQLRPDGSPRQDRMGRVSGASALLNNEDALLKLGAVLE